MLRPKGVGELLDASFGVFRRRFGTLAVCVLVVVAPLSVVAAIIQLSAVDGYFDFDRTGVQTGGSEIAGLLVSNLLTAAAVAIATAACFRAVHADLTKGEDIGWRASVGFATSKAAVLLVTLVLYAVLVVIGTLLCIAPGVYLFVAFSLGPAIVLFEDRRVMGALQRSRELVKDRWWPTFGAELVMYVLVGIVQGLAAALISSVLFASSSNEAVNAVVLTAATVASYVVSVPLQSALVTLIYFDLRVRKEGLDLEIAAEGIGAPPAPPPPAPPSGGFLPPEPPR